MANTEHTRVAPPWGRVQVSLQDAVTLLSLLDVTDAEATAHLRMAVDDLVRQEGLPPPVHDALAAAAACLARAAAAPASAATHVAEAGRYMEAAASELDAAAAPAPAERPPVVVILEPPSEALALGTSAPSTAGSGQPVPDPAPAPAAVGNSPPTVVSGDLVLPPDAEPDLLHEFIAEAGECIASAEASLLALETDPESVEAINTVFRAFHTIKGSAGFLGLPAIGDFAHRVESFLSTFRDGSVRCTPIHADLALRAVDVVKALVDRVGSALEGAQAPLPHDYADVLRALDDPALARVGKNAGTVEPRLGDILVAQGIAARQEVEGAVAAKNRDEPIGAALVRSKAASAAEVVRALRTQRALTQSERTAPDTGVRVRTERVEQLVDAVGELVIAHSMNAQDVAVAGAGGGTDGAAGRMRHTTKIVRRLQELSLSMRMVPLQPTFQKMARLVREVARATGKQVDLVTIGEDTEIDRNLVDALNDPLLHLIRNAIDHGIESPEVRVERGKPAPGTLRLSAQHAAGMIVVELSDDGDGLNREKILRRAVERGLVEPGASLTDAEVFDLIFTPGFSTADQVSSVSGRGVGLDVVRRNVQQLRGRLEVSSEPGRGTTFRLRLPLTLAVGDGMVVRVGEERYVLPTASIVTTFRPAAEDLATLAGRGELVRFRGAMAPLLRLHGLLGIEGAQTDPLRGLLVVVETGVANDEASGRFALLVDELLGQQQVVFKPLGDFLGRVRGVTGSTVLPDGRVGLIMEPSELLDLARLLTNPRGATPAAAVAAGEPRAMAERDSAALDELSGQLLTFTLGGEEHAVDIVKVQEIISLLPATRVPNTLRWVRGVVNLRGRVLPVVDLREKLGMAAAIDSYRTCVVFLESRGYTVGMVVDAVTDVLRLDPGGLCAAPDVTGDYKAEYVLGMAVDAGRVTRILHVDRVLGTVETGAASAGVDVAFPPSTATAAAAIPPACVPALAAR